MLLQDFSPREVTTATPDTLIGEVAKKMRDANVGAVVILVEDRVRGIVTDRDIALSLALGEAAAGDAVKSIMTTEVKTIWQDQGIFNATQYFMGHRVRRLPVIDRQDKLVGMISVDDVFGLLSRELFNVARALEPSLGMQV